MSPETIEFEVDDRVAIVRLNRPERMNAWNDTLAGELAQAMERCDGDDGIRAVVVTGNGHAFCAGADMSAGSGTFGDFAERRSKPSRQQAERANAGYAGPSPGRSASRCSPPSTATPSAWASPTR